MSNDEKQGVDYFEACISDDESTDGPLFSAANWSQEENAMMADAIEKIESELHAFQSSHDEKNTASENGGITNIFKNRCSTGYSAHTEAVDAKELLTWKSNFVYLKVVGVKIEVPENLPVSSCPDLDEDCSVLF
jgi:hypothetical protein